MRKPFLITGNYHEDKRGKMYLFNEFDMAPIQRTYQICPSSTTIIRAWQGHVNEEKWFNVLNGSFEVKVVPFENINDNLIFGEIECFILNATSNDVLHIPGGYLNGFRALDNEAVLQVFSNVKLDESLDDDIRVDLNQLAWSNSQDN